MNDYQYSGVPDRTKIANFHCPNCGAVVNSEVCPYCQAATGINTWKADMEYPVIECKEANLGFWRVWFPLIFAVSFGIMGAAFTVAMLKQGEYLGVLFISIFDLIGLVALIIALKNIYRNILVKLRGKEIDATVYGYMDDNVLLNGVPAQIVKLLVHTKQGPRFILYQLGDIKHPYKINSKIKLKAFKDMFLIMDDTKEYF
ncbi:MAG: zinc ribbon domain-containing protein [Bacteroidales bacterium]|nr:zinc ribbon domain-containing protein [Bacteroidales bacterium]